MPKHKETHEKNKLTTHGWAICRLRVLVKQRCYDSADSAERYLRFIREILLPILLCWGNYTFSHYLVNADT